MGRFYARLLKRQARLGAVRLFCIAIILSSGVTFSITLLSDRLEQLFQQQAKEVLAADLVFKTSTQPDEQQLAIMSESGLKQARTASFRTMANAGDNFVLASAKAVSAGYPLLGQLQVTDSLYGEPSPVSHGPAPGEAWVEDRVLSELDIQIGDHLQVGQKKFLVRHVLVFEPDRGNSFYSFTPRIMFSLDDLESTAVLQVGSRANFRWLFSGEPSAITALEAALEETLQPNQEFVSVESANETLTQTLERAYRFLHVTVLLAVLLGAVAVALVSFQYAREMTYEYAVLRCLGLSGKALRRAIMLPLAGFTLVSIALGLLLGGGVHLLILRALEGLVPAGLPAASAVPWLVSSLTSMVIVVSFAWPFLKDLLQTPPKILLAPEQAREMAWKPVAFSVFAGVLVLVSLNTRSVIMSVALVCGIAVFVLLCWFAVSSLIRKLVAASESRPVRWRLAARFLNANRAMASLQVIAIMLTFFSLALVQTLRDDLISSWQDKVPEDAPNFFVINLFDADLDDFSRATGAGEGAGENRLYPIIRGRLTEINGEPVKETVTKESRGDRATQRDLSLTFADQLPADNRITEGEWHAGNPLPSTGEEQEKIASVSVESKLAENLNIKVGDSVGFVINTRQVKARVSSLREVEWESFRPNFYFIFDRGALSDFSRTWLTSFRIEKEKRHTVASLLKQFPNATFFDVDFMLDRIRGITAQVGLAVESVLYFSVFASLVVFLAIEMILYHNRQHTTAVLKSHGATTSLIQGIFRGQFLVIGLIAGVFAWLLNLLAGTALSVYILESTPVLNFKTLVLCLVITPLLVVLAGQVSIARTRDVPARLLLGQAR